MRHILPSITVILFYSLQNNEKEKIISRRYPDAVPALLRGEVPATRRNLIGIKLEDKSTQTIAAKAAQQSVPQPIPKSSKQDFVNRPIEVSEAQKFLNEKIKRLERELERKDNETDRLLMNSEARYQDMGKRYEEHINVLQTQLHDASAKLKSHKMKIKEKESAMDLLLKERKSHDIEPYQATARDFTPPKTKTAKQKNRGSSKQKGDRKEINATAIDSYPHSLVEHALSPVAHHKCELENISLLKENTDLKEALGNLQSRYEEQCERQITDTAKFQMECSEIRSHAEAEMQNLKIKHNEEMEQKQTERSAHEVLVKKLQNDIDRMQKKIEDQDLIVGKLNEKVLESVVDKELLQASKVRAHYKPLSSQVRSQRELVSINRGSKQPIALAPHLYHMSKECILFEKLLRVSQTQMPS